MRWARRGAPARELAQVSGRLADANVAMVCRVLCSSSSSGSASSSSSRAFRASSRLVGVLCSLVTLLACLQSRRVRMLPRGVSVVATVRRGGGVGGGRASCYGASDTACPPPPPLPSPPSRTKWTRLVHPSGLIGHVIFGAQTLKGSERAPGDFGFDPLGLGPLPARAVDTGRETS